LLPGSHAHEPRVLVPELIIADYASFTTTQRCWHVSTWVSDDTSLEGPPTGHLTPVNCQVHNGAMKYGYTGEPAVKQR
jgi:hypothetical protein